MSDGFSVGVGSVAKGAQGASGGGWMSVSVVMAHRDVENVNPLDSVSDFPGQDVQKVSVENRIVVRREAGVCFPLENVRAKVFVLDKEFRFEMMGGGAD